MISIYDCSVIELPKISNRAGNITPVHSGVNVPFDIKRVFTSTIFRQVNLAVRMRIKNVISFWLPQVEVLK